MRKAKQIIAYCNNQFLLTCSCYLDFDSLMSDADEIKKYGDIPTCRRAINLLNNDPKITHKLEIHISSKTSKKLQEKEMLKSIQYPKLTITRKQITLTFD